VADTSFFRMCSQFQAISKECPFHQALPEPGKVPLRCSCDPCRASPLPTFTSPCFLLGPACWLPSDSLAPGQHSWLTHLWALPYGLLPMVAPAELQERWARLPTQAHTPSVEPHTSSGPGFQCAPAILVLGSSPMRAYFVLLLCEPVRWFSKNIRHQFWVNVAEVCLRHTILLAHSMCQALCQVLTLCM
jgi:hypothetical protein